MVESQIRPNGVNDQRILDAFQQVPRERFVPQNMLPAAYIDEDVAVGAGRFLLEPLTLARLVQALEISPEDLVLDIGCSSGYSSVILSRLALTVVALESDAALAAQATENLSALGADNVVVMQEELQKGYPNQAPYNAVLVNGALPALPDDISRQLADGGRICFVQSVPGGMGQATLVLRRGEAFSRRVLFDAAIPPLAEFSVAPGFVF